VNIPLDYRFLAPKTKQENPPLLIMLHGYGSDENDLFSFADQLNSKFLIVSLKAPFSLPMGGNAWYEISYSDNAEKWTNIPQAKSSREVILKCIKEIQREFATGETYLLGFSQGAILSYSLSLSEPTKFAGVLALSGYIEPKLIPEKLDAEKYPSYFGSHGAQDPVIPINWARKAQTLLNSNKIDLEFNEYQMAHGINPECFHDMASWLKSKGVL